MNVIQDLSWEWKPRKIEIMSSMKRFEKKIRCSNVKIIVGFSLPTIDWHRGQPS